MDNLLKPDFGLMIFTIITFVLLLVVLEKFAWKPIIDALEQRESKIRSDIDRAEKANADAQTLRQKYEAQITQAQQAIQNMVAQAKVDGERMRDKIVDDARNEANRVLAKGKQDLNVEAEKLRGDLRQEVAGLSVLIAEKILQRSVDPKTQETVLADALKSMGKN